MYNYIRGLVIDNGKDKIILECNNIGFNIYVNDINLYVIGEEYKIFVYNFIKENENVLYGFKTNKELLFFEDLIKVKGIGPKLAVSMIRENTIELITNAINCEDIKYLTSFSKVGERLANQIVIELKNKIKINENIVNYKEMNELICILENFGYRNKEIKDILNNIDKGSKLEEQIKLSLKLLAGR